jgi:phosphate transport system substrate-binding protein
MTDYLSTVSSSWFDRVGRGKTVPWPVGIGGNGNGGVAASLQAHPGSIGYLELAYAIDSSIPYALVQNKAGAFVLPTASSIQAAGVHFPDINSRHYSIVDADGATTYPIAGYSWVLLRGKPSPNQAAVVALFRWLTTSGQEYAAQVHNVPLPPNVRQLAASLLATIPT